jgi:hypothetical protein
MGACTWAGTETATISYGAIDGAVRSGERVASEILPVRERSLEVERDRRLVSSSDRRCSELFARAHLAGVRFPHGTPGEIYANSTGF